MKFRRVAHKDRKRPSEGLAALVFRHRIAADSPRVLKLQMGVGSMEEVLVTAIEREGP